MKGNTVNGEPFALSANPLTCNTLECQDLIRDSANVSVRRGLATVSITE